MKREFFGHTIEEALEKASVFTKIAIPELKYTEIEGVFGSKLKKPKVAVLVEFDKTPVKKAASIKHFEEEVEAKKAGNTEWAKYFVEQLFILLGFDTNISVNSKDENTILGIDINRGDLDLRKGFYRELRGAIQHLINRSTLSITGGEKPKRYILDIGGQLEERTSKLKTVAETLAEKVKKTNNTVHIHLMDGQDRRIVHTTVESYDGAKTSSTGQQQYRIISVEPEKPK